MSDEHESRLRECVAALLQADAAYDAAILVERAKYGDDVEASQEMPEGLAREAACLALVRAREAVIIAACAACGEIHV